LKELEKKVLEMNHYRYMEIKNIENFIHNELVSIKSELGNLVYTYLFLQNNFSEALQGIKGLQQALGSYGEVQVKNNEIFRKHETLFNELQIKYDNRLQELQLKNNEINESISRLRKILINSKAPVDTKTQVLAAKQSGETLQGSMLDYIYYDLENILRGKEEEIRFRQLDYLEYLKDVGPVLDVGCGRGELLELLARHGIEAVGVDSNKLMVEYCVSKGLKVTHADGMLHIANLPDGSLGAITALHVIEHLDLNSLCNFLVQALNKIKDGGILILETPNPLGLFTLSQSFYLDFSHLRPVHPTSLKLLLESMGFTIVKLLFLSPWEDAVKLTPFPSENNDKVIERVNENFDKLNEIIFAPREYSIVAKK
jgi:2-polyprenyl-3-methyl-5-hydroxy-6-metoxy-1,4-benzoquinol methylase